MEKGCNGCNRDSELAIACVVRVPRIGNGKRRLAAVIGDEHSAAVYCTLCRNVISQCMDACQYTLVLHDGGEYDHAASSLVASTLVQPLTRWKEETRQCIIGEQAGETLAQRVENALEQAFALDGVRFAAACATDVPSLSVHDLARAEELLLEYDAVLGPSPDGGFYLLAVSCLPSPGSFDAVAWSTSDARKSMQQQLERQGMSVAPVHLMRSLQDIDQPADICNWLSQNRGLPPSEIQNLEHGDLCTDFRHALGETP